MAAYSVLYIMTTIYVPRHRNFLVSESIINFYKSAVFSLWLFA